MRRYLAVLMTVMMLLSTILPAIDADPQYTGSNFLSFVDGGYTGFNVSEEAYHVTHVGDIDCDGIGDIAVGAPMRDFGGTESGFVYLMLGKASGWTNTGANIPYQYALVSLNAGDHAGYSVAAAGDVNGDGMDDLIVGAPDNDTGGTNAGAAYLVFGRPTNNWDARTNWALQKFVQLVGENAGDRVGHSVAGNVDVNGDGIDDVIIGAANYTQGGTNERGKVYVVLGHRGNWASSIDLSQADGSYLGDHANEHIGHSISGAYDINADGYDDIVFGAPNFTEASNMLGIAYVVLGASSLDINTSIASAADLTYKGINDGDEVGFSVAGVRDIDNDGYDDILIGAPGYSTGLSNRGAVYVIYGNSTANLTVNDDLTKHPEYLGNSAHERYGYVVAGLGDFNADFLYDYAISSPYWDWAGGNEGLIYIYQGSYGRVGDDYDAGCSYINFLGDNTGDLSGLALSGGDVNGDGYSDFLVGGLLSNSEGQFWVIFHDFNVEWTENADQMELYLDDCNHLRFSEIHHNYTICVHVLGEDPDFPENNILRVRAVSDHPGAIPLNFTLLEDTNWGVGQFKGYFTIKPDGMTNKHRNWIGAPKGASITVSLVNDSNNFAVINVSKAIWVDGSEGSILGDYEDDRLGVNMVPLGDINEDGYDDFAVGHQESDLYFDNGGAVYVFYGRQQGFPQNMSLSDANIKIMAEQQGGMLGSGVSAGDVNGDGKTDFLYGAPLASADGGAVNIKFGNSTTWESEATASEFADLRITDGGGSLGAGFSVASGGDVNGDGIDDIMVNAIASPDMTMTGWTYLFLGREVWEDNLTMENATGRWMGEEMMDWSGNRVDISGDANGDGLCDILMSANGNDQASNNAGKIYLIFGRTKGWSMEWNLTKDFDASYIGDALPSINSLGTFIGFVGDIDQDGYDDFYTSSDHRENGHHSGRVFIIKGKESGWPKNATISDAADITFIPSDKGSDVRFAAGIGDFNGDMRSDLYVGGMGSTTIVEQGGLFSVVHGTSKALPSKINISHISHLGLGDTYWGAVKWEEIGGPAIASDIDGDGWNDLLVGAPYGDIPHQNCGGIFVVKRGNNSRPTGVSAVELYRDMVLTSPVSEGSIENEQNEFWVKLAGTDNDPDVINTAQVKVTSTKGDKRGIKVNLNETGPSTGIFVGSFYTDLYSTPGRSIARVLPGDHVIVEWVQDSSINLTFKIMSSPKLIPIDTPTTNIREDRLFKHTYRLTNATFVTYNFSSAEDFMHWDEENMTVWGIPNNTHVGPASYKLEVLDDQGQDHEQGQFFLVRNYPPHITTLVGVNKTNITEDEPFEIDLDSDDDGQGVITWAFTTNTTGDWFSFNSTTGVLNGTPTNDEVGSWWFNITVDDGNDGTDWMNLTLNVSNTNDAPFFTTTPPNETFEGLPYQYDADAIDVDGDEMSFTLDSTIEGMINDFSTGVIFWEPRSDQVGTHHVIVNVSDGSAFAIQEYDLKVMEMGEIPTVKLVNPLNESMLDSTNPEITWEGRTNTNATLTFDVYLGPIEAQVRSLFADALVAKNISNNFYRASELVPGVRYFWTVIPIDGDTTGICIDGVFWFNVSKNATTNNPPSIFGTPPDRAYVGIEYQYSVEATDPDSDVLTYGFDGRPAGMLIDPQTGDIKWTPTDQQIGSTSVTVTVTDGKLTGRMSWSILVLSGFNNPPELVAPIGDKKVKVGQKLRFTVLVYDADNDVVEFSLGMPRPDGTSIVNDSGLFTWTPKKDQVGDVIITIILDDGKNQTRVTFNVTVVQAEAESGLDMMTIGLLIVVIIAIAIIATAIAMRRRKKDLMIDDIFLIYKDGRLIEHNTRRLKPEMDGDLIGGMFTAVQEFITSSFKPDAGGAEEVNEIRYGDYRVLIEHGKNIFIAVSAKGEGAEGTIENMKRTVLAIERRYGPVLDTWDGDKGDLKDVQKGLTAITTGEDPAELLGVDLSKDAEEEEPPEDDEEEEDPSEEGPEGPDENEEDGDIPEPSQFQWSDGSKGTPPPK